jgi:exosortase E/protease (VPEID-CTERM system)
MLNSGTKFSGALRAKPTLVTRVIGVALLLFFEKFLLDQFIDYDAVHAARGLGEITRVVQHWGFRFFVSLGVALALFVYVRGNSDLSKLNSEVRESAIRYRWLIVHGALLLALIPLSYSLYGSRGLSLPFSAVLGLWLVLALGAVLAAAAAVAPCTFWRRAGAAIGSLWLYAGFAALAAAGAMQWSQKLWVPTARITFDLVRVVLSPLIPSLRADQATLILSTDHFAVQVAEVCSGLEGIGLMLAFCSAWLLYFRQEYIFPRALLLIPTGLVLIFALNVVRIGILVLIGDAGFPEVAVFGFHSQAGWIAFNIAACAIVIASRRSRWLSHVPTSNAAAGDNATAAYLMPFLAIVAAGILAHAASSGFELLYPLRLVAGAVALWAYRARLGALDWRVTWRGPAIGLGIFLLWLVAARYLVLPRAMPAALAAMAPQSKVLWVTARIGAAMITVPIAEELAFRGYLLRRLQSADFESLQFTAVGRLPLLISALTFGLMHGALWLPGIVAGLAYGYVLQRTGRFGEAVAAHATTNALLTGTVLLANQWQLW